MSDVKVSVLSAGLSHLWLGEALALTRHGGPKNETLTMCIYGHKGSTVFGVGLIVKLASSRVSFNICKCDITVYFQGHMGHSQPCLWRPQKIIISQIMMLS